MEILDFQTVDSLPALYHPELDLIVISDVHLGLEGAMTFDGHYVPKHQLDTILEDVKELKQETGASKILVNGDLKNEFKGSRKAEKDEIKSFLDLLDQKFDEIILIEGNHDTFLEKTVEDYGLKLRDSYIESGIAFTHGHISLDELDISGFETLVIGHEHPALALKDQIGIKEKVGCFLYGDLDTGDGEDKKIVVMPAFSSISAGTNVNETPKKELLSPILRENVSKSRLKAVAVSREAGIFEFPEIGKL